MSSLVQEIRQFNSFQFVVISVNDRGEKINQEQRRTEYFAEDLGNDITLDLVTIPGGSFTRGEPPTKTKRFSSEVPQNQVKVRSFYMSKYTVTQAQWRQVANLPLVDRHLKLNPSYFQGDNLPVENVSWYDAVEFCKRLSQTTGVAYRLPTEAEWEYACRAKTTTSFHFGPTITSDLANYWATYTYAKEPKGEYRKMTTAVGSFQVANGFGLSDMHGNVWEWCQDDWHDNYENSPVDGTAFLLEISKAKIIRGGSWYLKPSYCRAGFRNYFNPRFFYRTVGFRVVCVTN